MKSGLLVVVSGASGTGKGTVLKKVLEKENALSFSVSATTRAPRAGEQHGVEYYFQSREEFEKLIAAEGFLEWAEVYGNYYGTPMAKTFEKLAAGKDVLLEIDTQGALSVMEKCPEGVFIFLLPPSLEELKKRIEGRGTETKESLERRLAAAKKEIALARKYQYVVVNDVVEDAAAKIITILAAERMKSRRNREIMEELTK